MARGWIGFGFKNSKEAEQILHHVWLLGKSSLVLKHWHPLFDPRKDTLESFSIWVKLPCLPLEFWSQKGFKAIGDAIGKFMAVDADLFSSQKRYVARIQVEVDAQKGLFESINLLIHCLNPLI